MGTDICRQGMTNGLEYAVLDEARHLCESSRKVWA